MINASFQIWSEALGWTIVHSLWQITVLAIVLRVALFFIAQRASKMRYGLALGTMVVAATWSGYTFYEQLAVRANVMESIHILPQLVATPTLVEPLVVQELTWWQSLEQHIPILSLVWLIGVILFATYTLHAWWQLRQLQQEHSQVAPSEWQAKLSAWQQQLGISRRVQLLCSNRVSEPITFRHLRPVIIVPISLLTELPAQQVEILLLHELAHIRRYDYLVNWGQAVLEVLFFYHPAIWWLSRQVRTEREHCCDDWVMRVHHEPMVYAQALTQLQLSHYSLKTNLVMSATKNQGSFTTRIHRLFGKYPSATLNRKGAFVVLLLLALCVGLTTYPSQAANSDREEVIDTSTYNDNFIAVGDTTPTKVVVLNKESAEGDVIYHVKGRLNEDGNWEYNHLKSNGETLEMLDQSEIKELIEQYGVGTADVRLIQGQGVIDTFISFDPILDEESIEIIRQVSGEVETPAVIKLIKSSDPDEVERILEEEKITINPEMNVRRDTIVTFNPDTFEEITKVVTTYVENDVEVKVDVKEINDGRVVKIQGMRTDTIITFDPDTYEEKVKIVTYQEDVDKSFDNPVEVKVIGTKENAKTDPPLFVVNGEIVEIELADISAEDIKEIHILKGDPAIEKYGEAGRNGVIEITMKKKNWKRKKKGEEEIFLDFAVPPAPPAPPAPPVAPDAPPAPPTIDLEEALKDNKVGKFEGNFSVYPNPANELVNIRLRTKNSSEVMVHIFNSLGQQVYARYIEVWQGRVRFEWDTAGVPNGVYTAIVSIDGVKRSQQLVVEH